jgi:hypothetical protein
VSVLSLGDLVRAWNEFFFAPASPLPLAYFRIVFGVVLTIESLGLLRWGNHLFHPRGVRGIDPDDNRVRWVFCLHSISCICLSFGLLTRLAAAVIFVNFCFRTRRNWLVIQGGDNVAKLMSLLLVFSNCGGALSIDAHFGWHLIGGESQLAPQWPQRLMQLEVSIIYLRTASWKLRATEWLDGTAAFHALHRNINLRRFFNRRALQSLLSFSPVAALLTWSTLGSEVFVGVFLWFRETRNAAILIAVTMHLSFELFLSIKQFQWMMMTTLLLFLTTQDWDILRELIP